MNASTTDAALDLQARIRARRVAMAYASTGPALFGNLLVAALGMVILFPVAPTLASLTWILVFLGIVTVRWSLERAYARLTTDRLDSVDLWVRRLLVVVTLNGLGWGAFAILMLVYANPIQVGFGPFVVGGMVAASVATLGPLKSAYMSFTLPIVSGLIIGLIWRGGYDALFMAAFTVAFELTMIGTVKKVSEIVGHDIELRLQNEHLVESLTAANRSLGHEIEERRRAEARSEFLASHDALTGLPNRRMQKDHFAGAVAQVARGGGAAAILFVDLDRFKQVNDTLGHPTGDALLNALAERLRALLREGDSVCRHGGDEFLLVMPTAADRAKVSGVAERLIQSLSTPVEIAGNLVQVGCSIGISLYPSDGDDFDLLVSRADMALYRAKHQGRGTYRFFTPELDLGDAPAH
ncbi:sensor domain-containing diguanylate cyclase [Thiocystis violacea]|uniref:GGDEF domain-containing protein n=1 Tax=Thiocystis violacea TaxID=13725 RepID=UPI0019068E2B|nr:diguanylate cyclase [Thiocystis violacea]MBK1717757.1 hypothetical protein [Thiocystis violacea]